MFVGKKNNYFQLFLGRIDNASCHCLELDCFQRPGDTSLGPSLGLFGDGGNIKSWGLVGGFAERHSHFPNLLGISQANHADSQK